MRKLSLLCSSLLLAALTAFAANPPATVTVDTAAKKQGPVQFSHEKHMKLAKTCEQCHHKEKGLTATSKVEVKKCSSCHLDSKDKAPSMREMSMTKNPFHVRCLACHKEQKKGPVTCTGCHKKK